jgi:hypothetical protein
MPMPQTGAHSAFSDSQLTMQEAAPDVTMPAPLEPAPSGAQPRTSLGLNLFWRTFFLLALLLAGSILAWLQILRVLEFEPRTLQMAQQAASLVNLSRAALVHADPIARVSLIKTMAEQEGVRIMPREPGDRYEPLAGSALARRSRRSSRAAWAPTPSWHRA